MKGLQEAAYLLVCLAWEMLALAKALSFPDIPQLSWPWELGQRSQALALLVVCSVAGRKKSDHEVSEPPWPSGSFLPITQHSILFWSHTFSDHQRSALWEQQIRKSGQGLMLGSRESVRLTFPFATSSCVCQTKMTLHVLCQTEAWYSSKDPFLSSSHVRCDPCDLISSVLTQLIENSGKFWKHLIPNSLINWGVKGEQGFSITWLSELIERVYSPEILYWPHSRMSQPEPHQKKQCYS